MFFKCKNCGGNILYNADKGTMCCPNCDGIDSEDKLLNTGAMEICFNCGAPMDDVIKEHTSATKCPSCGTYTILEQRIDGEFTPDEVLPFKVSKEKAVKLMKAEFAKRLFTPAAFLGRATVNVMEGMYVPFFMYDYDTEGNFTGTATRVRHWSDSKYDYTETSYYNIVRRATADYERVPVDAAVDMEDGLMDLLEPYHYEGIENFDPKYMSGFFGEKYSETKEQVAPRAIAKVKKSLDSIIRSSITGYNSVSGNTTVSANQKKVRYTLMPVWEYVFKFQGKDYKIHVNGQTGKVIGKTPVDKGLVVAYGATVFGIVTIICELIRFAFTI